MLDRSRWYPIYCARLPPQAPHIVDIAVEGLWEKWGEPGRFARAARRGVFNASPAVDGRGEPGGPGTLPEELRRMGSLEALGGKPYIPTLASSVPTAGAATHYARIVEENALLRRLADAA